MFEEAIDESMDVALTHDHKKILEDAVNYKLHGTIDHFINKHIKNFLYSKNIWNTGKVLVKSAFQKVDF